MYALEFESAINGNVLEIPPHLLKRLQGQHKAKVILLMPEAPMTVASAAQKEALKARIQAIQQRYAALPLVDQGAT